MRNKYLKYFEIVSVISMKKICVGIRWVLFIYLYFIFFKEFGNICSLKYWRFWVMGLNRYSVDNYRHFFCEMRSYYFLILHIIIMYKIDM